MRDQSWAPSTPSRARRRESQAQSPVSWCRSVLPIQRVQHEISRHAGKHLVGLRRREQLRIASRHLPAYGRTARTCAPWSSTGHAAGRGPRYLWTSASPTSRSMKKTQPDATMPPFVAPPVYRRSVYALEHCLAISAATLRTPASPVPASRFLNSQRRPSNITQNFGLLPSCSGIVPSVRRNADDRIGAHRSGSAGASPIIDASVEKACASRESKVAVALWREADCWRRDTVSGRLPLRG